MAKAQDLPHLFDEPELARRIGVPAELLRAEREAGRLDHYRIAGGAWFTTDMVSAWLARVRACPEKTPGLTSCGSRSGKNTTSATPTRDAAASSPRVSEIAAGLKRRSPRSLRPEHPGPTLMLVASEGQPS